MFDMLPAPFILLDESARPASYAVDFSSQNPCLVLRTRSLNMRFNGFSAENPKFAIANFVKALSCGAMRVAD